MGFTLPCPKCSLSLAATDGDIGKQGKCSRCGEVFTITTTPVAAPPPPVLVESAPVWSGATPGVIRVGEGLSRAFAVLHSNLGTFLLLSLCFLGIHIVLGLAGAIPCLGVFVALASTFVLGPAFTSGFYRACLKQHDGGQAQVEDLFSEFDQWVDYLLLVLVGLALAIAVCFPGLIVLVISFVPMMRGQHQPNVPMLIAGVITIVVFLIGLGMAFLFAYPALVDRRQGFWDAIQTSWRLSMSNPLGALGAMLLGGIFAILGGMCIWLFCLPILYAVAAVHCLFASIYRTAVPPRGWIPQPLPTAPPLSAS